MCVVKQSADSRLLQCHKKMIRSAAFAIDIDGVLIRGSNAIASAADAIQKLQQNRVPHVFLTNGGGVFEETKAEQLSKKLNIHISKDQVILSHTPMRKLAESYNYKRVLILGPDRCVPVAKSYGFTDIVTCHHLHTESPLAYNRKSPRYIENHSSGKVHAVMIFDDPMEWALEMQILTDILLGSGSEFIPFYTSNSDIVYMSSHQEPRYTQGAFTLAFKSLFESYSGKALKVTRYGKPFPVQYRYAEDVLRKEASRLNLPSPTIFVGIGDNPASDIRGANNAGAHWISVLVKTGVFKGENDPQDPADYVFNDIYSVISHFLG